MVFSSPDHEDAREISRGADLTHHPRLRKDRSLSEGLLFEFERLEDDGGGERIALGFRRRNAGLMPRCSPRVMLIPMGLSGLMFTRALLLAAAMSLTGCPAVDQSASSPTKPGTEIRWSEYAYPKDGFAASFPYAPSPHKDDQVPDGTAYSVSLSGWGLTLHVANYPEGCSERFAQYLSIVRNATKEPQDRDRVKSGFRGDPASVKEIMVDGYPAVEHVQEVIALREESYERWHCVGSRFYIFSATWPREQAKPSEVTRIVNSFRLLPK